MKNVLKYILGGLLVGTIAVAATNRVWESQEWLSGQITTPSNPSAGKFKFYFKSDGEMYKLNSAGVEEQVGGGGSAAEVTFASSGTLVASNVQDALQELDGDIVAHLGDTSDAHDASAISNVGAGGISSTDVQSAINELDTEKAPKLDPTLNGNVTIASLTASRAVVSDGSSVLTSSATTATEIGYVNGVTRALQTQLNEKAEGRNILLNPNFELSTNWTASGGATSAINTTAVGTGSNGYDWDSNSASQTLSSDSVTIPNGMKGKSAVVSCAIKTVSGSATHTLQAYDGTNILASTSITSDTGSFARTSLNFVFPTSGSAVLRLVSVASNEPEIYIDDCYMGLAEGFNIGSISQYGDWIPYTPTFTGFGTVTVQNFKYRTAPSGVEIEGSFTSGTPTAVEARISLPSICTASSDYVTLEVAGLGARGIAGGENIRPLIEPSVTYLTIGNGGGSTVELAKANGNALITSGNRMSFQTYVRCQGFSSNTVYRPDQLDVLYEAYHGSGCTFSVTNTNYTALGDDASGCTLTEETERGVSCSSTGSVSPALSCTFPTAGYYEVCASFPLGGGSAALHQAQLYNGSALFGDEASESVGNITSSKVCGLLNVTSTSAQTISLRGKSASGSVTVNAGGNARAINWTIKPGNQARNAPVLVDRETVSIQHQESSGTAGGTFTSGSYQTRTLNTLQNPANATWVSGPTSNQFSLQAGTYRITGWATAKDVNTHKLRLRNITDSSDTLVGLSTISNASAGSMDAAHIGGVFTISAQKTFELQHRCQTTRATDGFGSAATYGDAEVYAFIEIEKIR